MPYFNIPERRVGSASVRVSPEDMGAGIAVAGVSQQVGQNISKGLGYLKEKQNKIDALNQSITASKFKSDLSAGISSLETEYNKRGGDPSGFADEADTQIDEKFEALKESVAPSQRLELEAKLLPYIEKQKALARSVEANLSSIYTVGQATENLDVVQNQILKGEMDVNDARDIVKDTTAVIRELDPKAAATYQSSAVDSVLSAEFQRVAQQYGADVAIDQYENTDKFDEMDPAIAQRLIGSVKSKGKVEVNRTLSFVKRALSMGAVPASDLSYEAAKAEKLGLHDEASELRVMAANKNKLIEFGRAPIQDKERMVRQAQSDMQKYATEESVLYASMVTSSYRDSLNAIKDDAYFYYESNGTIPSTQDLDFNNLEGFSEVLDERRAAQDQVLLHEGDSMLPLLKPHEVENLVSIFKTSPALQKADFMQAIATAAGWESFSEVAAQVAPKDRETARIMALAATKKNVAMEIIQGQGRQVDMPSNDKFIEELHRGNYVNSGLPPSVQKDAIESTKMLYAARFDGQEGDKTEVIQDAMRDVIGEPVELPNGSYMLPPIHSDGTPVEPRELRNAFRNFNAETWASTIGELPQDSTGLQLSIEDIKDQVQFVPHGPDGYFMVLKYQGTKGFPLQKSDGDILRIKHDQLIDLINSAPAPYTPSVHKSIKEGY